MNATHNTGAVPRVVIFSTVEVLQDGRQRNLAADVADVRLAPSDSTRYLDALGAAWF